jgi:hypothetical protein
MIITYKKSLDSKNRTFELPGSILHFDPVFNFKII